MIKMSVKFKVNPNGAFGRGGVKTRLPVAHAALDSQIIKDTDKNVPLRTGMLASSPLRASKVGEIVYDTPYARRLYYGDGMNFNQIFHSKAGPRWLDRAKGVWKDKWTALVARILGGKRGA